MNYIIITDASMHKFHYGIAASQIRTIFNYFKNSLSYAFFNVKSLNKSNK